jgi:hypothetical protein
MSIGFTGTQIGLTNSQRRNLKRALVALLEKHNDLHHGDCIGADKEAHDIARALSYRIILHPPTISSKRAFCDWDVQRDPLSYLKRNTEIVKESDILIACPKEREEQLRSGTWSTVRRARRYNKNIIILFPDGTISKEKGSEGEYQ